jgi:putative ubiquitin-RnfH superfamily antitoxin RatB of RatAB toxin-antitoxin module
MAVEDLLNVEVVYATKKRQEIIKVGVQRGATVDDAIEESRLLVLFPGESLDLCQTGIWGRLVERTQVLCDGDRVELYRQLPKDPRIARRERAMAS